MQRESRLTLTVSSLLVAPLVLMIAVPCTAGDDWKDTLKQALRAKYELTKTGIDRVRITKPGTVLILQQEGVSGDPSGDATYLTNKVVDGKVAQASGFWAVVQDKKRSRALKQGQTVYVYDIDVKDDHVRYFVITTDTYDYAEKGSTKQTRYKALLSFQFDKQLLPTMNADALKKAADAVVAPQAEISEASTKTIKLGQTRTEVEEILGKPERIADLGAKVTWIYKDMKVIFVDGKVSDIQ